MCSHTHSATPTILYVLQVSFYQQSPSGMVGWQQYYAAAAAAASGGGGGGGTDPRFVNVSECKWSSY